MSYTRITIAGKEVGLKFGYLSYKSIRTGKNADLLIEEDGTLTDIGLSRIIHSGYENNCVNKNIQAILTVEDFSRAIDEIAQTEEGKQILSDIITVWRNSEDVQNLIKDAEKKNQVADQSKETSMESNSLPLENLESGPGS